MSNKLVKKPVGYKEGKAWMKSKLDVEGGVNVQLELLDEINAAGIEIKDMEALIEILSDLSDEGYPIYRISRVCNGEETKGMMICHPSTVVAFTQNPERDFKDLKTDGTDVHYEE